MHEMWKGKHDNFLKKIPTVVPDEKVTSDWVKGNSKKIRSVFEGVASATENQVLHKID